MSDQGVSHTLILWLESTPEVALARTEFIFSRDHQRLSCVRSRDGSAIGSVGTFSWSPAVRALVLLLLQERLSLGNPCQEAVRNPSIVGGRGTPASSLDSALTKHPRWLVEMFGTLPNGSPQATRFFRRINASRRTGNQVIIGLNRRYLRPENIRVYLDGRELVDQVSVRQCAAEIQRSFHESKIKPSNSDVVNSSQSVESAATAELSRSSRFWEFLTLAFEQEMRETLNSVDIFRHFRYRERVQKLAEDPVFEYFVGPAGRQLLDIAQPKTINERLALGVSLERVRDILSDGTPLRVSITVGEVATHAILRYLKGYAGLNIEIDFSSPHAAQLFKDLSVNSCAPDLCTLAIGSVARALRGEDLQGYTPIMLMPCGTFRLIRSKPLSRGSRSSGKLLTYGGDISSSQYYLRELIASDVISSGGQKHESYEVDEIFVLLEDARSTTSPVQAIVYFPHHQFNEYFNRATSPTIGRTVSGRKEILLFASQRLANSREKMSALTVAIRDAWLTLSEQPSLRSRLVGEMLSDTAFRQVLLRLGGLSGLVSTEGVRLKSTSRKGRPNEGEAA